MLVKIQLHFTFRYSVKTHKETKIQSNKNMNRSSKITDS